MVTPEFFPVFDRATTHASGELDLEPKEHLTVQAYMRTVSEQLSRYCNPDKREDICEGIVLTGGIPLTLQDKIGAGFRTMNLRISQTPSITSDAAVKIELSSSELSPDMTIVTDISPSTSCGDKIFQLISSDKVNEEEPKILYGSDVCLLLDGILNTGGHFTQLTDPRKTATSFNGLVSGVAQLAKRRAPNPVESRSFSTETYDFAVAEETLLTYERNACLTVSKAGNGTRYRLDLFGLSDVGFDSDQPLAHVVKRVMYSYEQHKTENARNLATQVSVSSKELDREALQAYLVSGQRRSNVPKTIHNALKEIYDKHAHLQAQ